MPGSSLWLLPPTDHPLNKALPALIDKTSKQFGSIHRFLPHLTLTSEISPSKYGSDAQAWLDSLDLFSGTDVQIKFERLGSEDVFFRKLYIECKKSDGVKKLAQQCRQQVDGFSDENIAGAWVADKYMPHVSLMYHECPPVEADALASLDMLEVQMDDEVQMGGWNGGRVVLVPTERPIDQWSPIAERVLR